MVTIVELAKLAGVSVATVSLVLRGNDKGRVSAARRQQILDLARKHDYRPNQAARALVQGRSNRIGLCLTGTLTSHAIIGEFSLYDRLGLFAEAIQQAGYALEFIQANLAQPLEQLTRDLRSRPVDGIVFLDWPPDLLEKALFSLREHGIPVVVSGTRFADPGITWTETDSEAVFSLAAQRLGDEGRSQLVVVDTLVSVGPNAFRSHFAEAMARWYGPGAEGCQIVAPAEISFRGVYRATQDLLRARPEVDALLLPDNYLAQAVLDAVESVGRAPGDDVRVLGYGDTIFADQCHPRLSHYTRRIDEQVRFGLEALLEQINSPDTYQPRHLNVTPEYLQRET
jgi:LacI family transcriptional regulator